MGFSDATTFDGQAMSTPEAANGPRGGSPPPVAEAPRPRGGWLGWLLVRDELARARENAARFTPAQCEYLRRAKLALELGELALGPGSAVRSGSTAPLAADLFRQSVYWALLSRQPERAPASTEAIWATADGVALASVPGNDDERAQIATAMRSTFIELAEGSLEAQRATAQLVQRSALALVKDRQQVLWQLEWCKLKRLVRVASLAVICAIPLAFGLNRLMIKPDLAKGKAWHLSSVGIECHPEKSDCGGTTTAILFHTKLEQNPWFEYDFATPLAFSSLTIRNRSDCCAERAVPLVVEVSDDDRHFHEIARRVDAFDTWRPSFSTQHARYLRLRVPREAILHLEAIQVHP